MRGLVAAKSAVPHPTSPRSFAGRVDCLAPEMVAKAVIVEPEARPRAAALLESGDAINDLSGGLDRTRAAVRCAINVYFNLLTAKHPKYIRQLQGDAETAVHAAISEIEDLRLSFEQCARSLGELAASRQHSANPES